MMSCPALQLVFAGALLASFGAVPVCAQAPETPVEAPTPASGWPEPVKDNRVLNFVMFDQLEGRTNGPNSSFRWDGQGWIGTDFNKLWIKSEGTVTNGHHQRWRPGDPVRQADSARALLRLAGGCACRSRFRSNSGMGRNRRARTRSLFLQLCTNALYSRWRTHRGKNPKLVRFVPYSTPYIATSSRNQFL